MKGRTHPGSTVVHGSRCACDKCDPGQTKLKAARAAYLATPAELRAPAVLAKSAGARPVRHRRPPTDDTRRMSELLREGKTYLQAIDIIEAEKAQPRKELP